MFKYECDSCRKPIDPAKDNFIDVPQMHITYRDKGMRVSNLHFDNKGCFISWLQKHGEPSSIIAATNSPLGPSA